MTVCVCVCVCVCDCVCVCVFAHATLQQHVPTEAGSSGHGVRIVPSSP